MMAIAMHVRFNIILNKTIRSIQSLEYFKTHQNAMVLKNIRYRDTAEKKTFSNYSILTSYTRSIKQSYLENPFPSHIFLLQNSVWWIFFYAEITQSQTAIKYPLKTKYTLQAILSIFIFYGRKS